MSGPFRLATKAPPVMVILKSGNCQTAASAASSRCADLLRLRLHSFVAARLTASSRLRAGTPRARAYGAVRAATQSLVMTAAGVIRSSRMSSRAPRASCLGERAGWRLGRASEPNLLGTPANPSLELFKEAARGTFRAAPWRPKRTKT